MNFGEETFCLFLQTDTVKKPLKISQFLHQFLQNLFLRGLLPSSAVLTVNYWQIDDFFRE